MAILSFLVIPTYSKESMGIADNSIYDLSTDLTNPQLYVSLPGEEMVVVDFKINDFNVLDSSKLGLSQEGIKLPLPDGTYILKYSLGVDFVEKTFFRIENIQEKFDAAFLQLEMIECDRAIKKQSKIDLDTIYCFIQGAIASANNSAGCESEKLYNQANIMLDKFLRNNCGCN